MKADYPKDAGKGAAVLGFAQAKVMNDFLSRACKNGDLSRDGIVKAAHELSGVDTGGLTATTLDYTKLGQPSTRAAFIARPADVDGGLKQLGDPLESDEAKSFNPGS